MKLYVTKSAIFDSLSIWTHRPTPIIVGGGLLFARTDHPALVQYDYTVEKLFPNLHVGKSCMKMIEVKETKDGYEIKVAKST